ncbi:hypothetical protein [Bradyrhizobium sp. 174]|uniref:hypothetical protein n=1 Tax=Bradyrhizobium sp. 174 TaxID=2782645 RepID=UPI001FF8D4B3|nr:hypothetical protein [Bradyrhizobium sp. 174]MCK1573475.1 hypothetical protein [Bradyrhizobium sp. 174]
MRGNLLGNSSRTRKPSARIAQKANEPAAQFRLGSVVATVWRDGQSYSTVLAKTFPERDDHMHTDRLDSDDLMNAAKCLEQAERFVAAQLGRPPRR